MNSAMKALAAERAARNGSALPRQTPKPSPQGTRMEFTGQRVKAEPKAMFVKELNSVPRGLEDLYARHNAPEKEEGDAMAEDEEG